jgi:hypothetical protein
MYYIQFYLRWRLVVFVVIVAILFLFLVTVHMQPNLHLVTVFLKTGTLLLGTR